MNDKRKGEREKSVRKYTRLATYPVENSITVTARVSLSNCLLRVEACRAPRGLASSIVEGRRVRAWRRSRKKKETGGKFWSVGPGAQASKISLPDVSIQVLSSRLVSCPCAARILSFPRRAQSGPNCVVSRGVLYSDTLVVGTSSTVPGSTTRTNIELETAIRRPEYGDGSPRTSSRVGNACVAFKPAPKPPSLRHSLLLFFFSRIHSVVYSLSPFFSEYFSEYRETRNEYSLRSLIVPSCQKSSFGISYASVNGRGIKRVVRFREYRSFAPELKSN